MTRIFLAAGVAALAIAAPAAAGPGGGHGHGGGGGGGPQAQVPHGGGGGGPHGGGGGAPAFMGGGGGHGHGGGGGFAPMMARGPGGGGGHGHGGGAGHAIVAPQMQRQAFAPHGHQQRVAQQRPHFEQRGHGQQAQARMAQRQQMRAQQQNMRAERQQQAQARMAQREQLKANRQAQAQAQLAQRQQLQAVNGQVAVNNGYDVGGCPPGLAKKAVPCVPPGQAEKLGLGGGTPFITAQNAEAFRAAQVDALNREFGTRLLAPSLAASLLGAPIANAPGVLGMGLSPLPADISYLYPATPQYYYQYAPGYVYQVDRGTSLVDALIPLLAGGFLPGSTLPSAYMNSYVPNYYGLNSFYPSSYDYGYGGGYANLCNRYANGVVYQVDCASGMVENVIPMYAGGYGVGQMLPSAYSTYNVPTQYRDLYYPTSDYSYWYAPGAIYQYNPSNSLITSVAALLSPGMTVGQPLPAGYDAYNVPLAYRGTYYDTPNAWYRYNNGYIYQVDPTTQLVTAIVASLLT